MRIRHFAAAFVVLALSSCVPADEVPAEPERIPVDLQELDVRFTFEEPLALRASQDEALLTGTSTRMDVQSLEYGERTPGAVNQLAAWALPADIAAAVHDTRSCQPLSDARVFLPVDTQRHVACDLVLDPSGRTVVWMVGVGRPFEAVPFMQSSLLVLDDDSYDLFWYVYPLPESDATVQWLTDSFDQRHPHMSSLIWPNKSFLLLMDETARALEQQVSPPSMEVTDAMERLRVLAFSVDRSREAGDR